MPPGNSLCPETEPDPNLNNDDLKPTTDSQRTMSGWEMASLWVSLVVGVPTYYLAGSLVELGMAWWQGIGTIVFANTILLLPLTLTAQPGTRYGIPFPVLARSAFGIRGAHIPTLLRSLIACGWFGIETWIGGQAIFLLLLPSSFKNTSWTVPGLGTSPIEFLCFIFFWAAQLGFIWNGMGGIRALQKYSCPLLILLATWLFCWAWVRARGLGRMLSLPSRLSLAEFWSLFFPSLTASVGSWSTLALNIPDFTRFSRSQTDQVLGQLGLPIFMGAFTFFGLAVTSSTEVIFGRIISNPIELLGEINGGFFTAFLSIFGISLSIITTNIPANVVGPAISLANFCPSILSFKGGALLTGIIGIGFQPWRIYQSSKSYVYTWLVGCSAILGPISGILLTDYYIIHGMALDVEALYSANPLGPYYYYKGYNLDAFVALVVSVAPVIPGFLHQVGVLAATARVFTVIYSVAWFFGLFSAVFVYGLLSCLRRTRSTCAPASMEAPLLSVSG